MDPCRRIWFHSPAVYVARFLGIVATLAFVVYSLIAF